MNGENPCQILGTIASKFGIFIVGSALIFIGFFPLLILYLAFAYEYSSSLMGLTRVLSLAEIPAWLRSQAPLPLKFLWVREIDGGVGRICWVEMNLKRIWKA